MTGESSFTRSFGVGGTRETVMEASFKNTAGFTVNRVDITCGGSHIYLRSLALANGETLQIDHEDTGKQCVLRIRIQGTNGAWRSALDKRTADSTDDLTVRPGIISVTLYAGGIGTLLLMCAGRFA